MASSKNATKLSKMRILEKNTARRKEIEGLPDDLLEEFSQKINKTKAWALDFSEESAMNFLTIGIR